MPEEMLDQSLDDCATYGISPRRLRPHLTRLFVLFVLFAACNLATAAHGQTTYRLATGSKTGTYYKFGERIEALMPKNSESLDKEADTFQLEIVPTEGSQDNLERLVKGIDDPDVAHFAFCQQDVFVEWLIDWRADHASELDHLSEEMIDKRIDELIPIRVIDRVCHEFLHVFLRESIHIDHMGDLQGMRIWTGRERSGTRVTAQRFLEALGLPPSRYTVFDTEGLDTEGLDTKAGGLKFDDLAPYFQKRELDAAIYVTHPLQDSVVDRELKKGTYRLASLDHEARRILTLGHVNAPYDAQSFPATIPHRNVSSLAIPVLLLVRSEMGDSQVSREVWHTAKLAWEELEQSAPLETPSNMLLEESGLPLVWREDVDVEQRRSRLADALKVFLPSIALLVILLLVLRGERTPWMRRAWRRIYKSRLVIVGTSIVAFVLLVTFVTYQYEAGVNENFSTFSESFWSITLYLCSGLEDRVPTTTMGRLVATGGLILGPAVFAMFTAWMAAIFINWGKKMPGRLKDHFVILNWNARALEVIKQIHHPIMRNDDVSDVIVVLTDDISVDLKKDQDQNLYEDVFVSIGDPSDERDLRNASVQTARTIVVLADDRLGAGADERTIRAVFTLRKIGREQGSTLHVVAELLNVANAPILEEMAEEFPGLLETLAGERTRTYLVAQATLNQGLIGFYRELLSISDDTNELYLKEIPASAAGMNFYEYAAQVIQHTPQTPVIPVGVQRLANGRARMTCNPRPSDDTFILQEDDRLVVLAYTRPDDGVFPEPRTAAKA